MSDTNDEAQQPDQPPANQVRRTAMTVATEAETMAVAALELAQSVAMDVANKQPPAVEVTKELERLSEVVTELDQRTRGDVAQSDGVSWADEIAQIRRTYPDRDQVDARIAEALEDVHHNHQAFRQEMGGYQGGVNRRLDEHRTRITELEKRHDGDPAGETMAEDAQHDMVADMVKGQLSQLMARLEAAEQKAAKAEAALAQGMRLANPVAGVDPQYVVDLGDRVTALENHKENETSFTAQLQERVEELEAVWERASLPGLRPLEHTLVANVGGVHQKVLDLMRLVDSIGKDRKTDSGPRYSYRSIDDAMDAIGHAMREVGLVYTTEITAREVHRDEARNKEGNTLLWTTVLLTVRYTFIDPVDGSKQHFEMAGEGRASDDKATSKAAAMALKYGLLHALLIPVSGAVPDADAEQPQVSRAPQSPTQPPARQPAQESQPPRKPMTERARDAVTALQNLHRHPVERRSDVLAAIVAQAQQEGLLDIPVDTGDGPAPVKAYAESARATLAAGSSF
jgi:hypothetical protein